MALPRKRARRKQKKKRVIQMLAEQMAT